MTSERRSEIVAIRDVLTRAEVLRAERVHAPFEEAHRLQNRRTRRSARRRSMS